MPKKTSSVLAGFGLWLRTERIARGLTMEMLAERGDTAPAVISNLERGTRNASRDMVDRLARALSPEGADDYTARALLNAGLNAAGFTGDEIAYEMDPEALRVAEQYNGLPPYARRLVDSAVKSASELALDMDREGAIGKRAE